MPRENEITFISFLLAFNLAYKSDESFLIHSQSECELAKASQNPVCDIISYPFKHTYFGIIPLKTQ